MTTSTGTSVVARRSFQRVAFHDARLPADLAAELWERPESLVAMGEPLRVQYVRQTVRLFWAGQHYVLKHYLEPSRRHALKRTVLRSRARQTWNVMHKLADAGVATPRPVACVENCIGPLRRDSFLLYPYQEGRTLRSYVAGGARNSPPLMNRFWRELRKLWDRLAELRASLADTNLNNFIVCPAGRVWVIDLDKARFHRLAFAAAKHQRRGWNQLLRSLGKTNPVARLDSSTGEVSAA